MAFFNKGCGMLQHKITNNAGRKISASSPFLFQAIRCMSAKVFVGGLSYQTSEDTLRQTFEKYGQVYEARIITDRDTGNSRGFGFVTFENTEAASSAIMALDDQDLDGRRLKVNHAHDRGQGFGGGRNYNSGGGNYQGGGGYSNYAAAGGNYQGGGGYNNYGGGGNYQGGGSYQGGGGYKDDNDGNYQGGQADLGINPGGDGGYATTGGGSYGSNYVGGNFPNAGGNF